MQSERRRRQNDHCGQLGRGSCDERQEGSARRRRPAGRLNDLSWVERYRQLGYHACNETYGYYQWDDEWPVWRYSAPRWRRWPAPCELGAFGNGIQPDERSEPWDHDEDISERSEKPIRLYPNRLYALARYGFPQCSFGGGQRNHSRAGAVSSCKGYDAASSNRFKSKEIYQS